MSGYRYETAGAPRGYHYEDFQQPPAVEILPEAPVNIPLVETVEEPDLTVPTQMDNLRGEQ